MVLKQEETRSPEETGQLEGFFPVVPFSPLVARRSLARVTRSIVVCLGVVSTKNKKQQPNVHIRDLSVYDNNYDLTNTLPPSLPFSFLSHK